MDKNIGALFLRLLIVATLTLTLVGIQGESASAAGPAPDWQLPFPTGASWMAGAPHGGGALDFGPRSGDRTVVAAAAGTVYLVTCGQGSYLGIDHGNGWRSTYYHLVNEARNLVGQRVDAGTRLGDAGQALPCGGSSTFNHVHFSILRDGVRLNTDGLSIGGYTVHSSGSDYYGWWTRNSDGARVVTANGLATCCLVSSTTPVANNSKPDAPTVSGSTVGSPQISVSWNAPSDNGHPITHYDLVDNHGNYCGGIGANTRSITFPGGPCIYGKDFIPIVGLAYQFQVRGYNGVGSVDGVPGVTPWSDPSVAVVPLKSTGDPVVQPGTGHWYQVVYGITKWSDALSGAKARKYQGMVGHLATVTSQSEFDFIRSLEPNARLWLGARDTGPSGGAARTWTWIDGPEKGDTFTTCVQSTASASCKTISNAYTKWLPNQPDNYTPGEPFLELSQNGWNDCFDLCSSGVVGYVVEYEPISTTVSVSLPSRGTSTAKVALSGKVTPTVNAGKIQLVWKYKINGKYVDVETTSVNVSQGKFSVSKLLKQKGAWQVTAQYLGSGVAPVYQASKPVADFIIIY